MQALATRDSAKKQKYPKHHAMRIANTVSAARQPGLGEELNVEPKEEAEAA